jgi:Asp-tRNA(Asn)/Glu-tRNA(Gln) amidotransferase C subunit
MSTKQKAVVEIREFARSVKGILALADELEKVGSVENAAKEADARYDAARKREDEASRELAHALKSVETAKANADQMVKEARIRADQTVELGKKAAADILESGKAEAGRLVDAALLRIKDLEADKRRLEGYVEGLVRDINDKQAIVADLDKKIEAIRAKIS